MFPLMIFLVHLLWVTQPRKIWLTATEDASTLSQWWRVIQVGDSLSRVHEGSAVVVKVQQASDVWTELFKIVPKQ